MACANDAVVAADQTADLVTAGDTTFYSALFNRAGVDGNQTADAAPSDDGDSR